MFGSRTSRAIQLIIAASAAVLIAGCTPDAVAENVGASGDGSAEAPAAPDDAPANDARADDDGADGGAEPADEGADGDGPLAPAQVTNGDVVCDGSTVTLSGEPGAPAASSGTLPIGTTVTVSNLDNGKFVTVEVTSTSGSCLLLNNAAFELVREPGKFVIRRAIVQREGGSEDAPAPPADAPAAETP